MMSNKIKPVVEEHLKSDIPDFSAGDTVSIDVRVAEGGKERIQKFEGIVIGKKGSDVSATFTVRKISGGIGVERIFPLHSPMISNINVKRRGKVRRAKLYYLRERQGKSARIAERSTGRAIETGNIKKDQNIPSSKTEAPVENKETPKETK